MKNKIRINNLISFLANPYIISGIISLIILLFLPPVFDKYKAEMKEKKKVKEYQTYFYDLDKDAFSEKIEYHTYGYNKTSVIVFKNEERVIDQWNFKGNFVKTFNILFDDYDNNKLAEIYVFTYFNDSIFLNGFEPFNNKILIQGKFIYKNNISQKNADFSIFPCCFSDVNADGYKEFIFIINAGFSLQPRNLFIYDIKKDTVYKSPENGEVIIFPQSYDINDDKIPEIFVSSFASGNIHQKDFPYSDYYCWLMAFNSKAEFLFPPKKVGEYPSSLYTMPFRQQNNRYIAALYLYAGTKDIECSLQLYSTEGKLLKERKLGIINENLRYTRLAYNDPKKRNKLFLIYGNGDIEQFDDKLRVVDKKKIENVYYGICDGYSYSYGIIDADNDKTNEFLFYGKDGEKLILCRNNFTHPVVINAEGGSIKHYSVILNGKEPTELFLENEKYSFRYRYYINNLYYLKYLIYAGIFAGTLLFISLLNKIQQQRAKQKYEAEKKMAELQLKSVRNQIDSHFTLNILNSIGSLLYKQDTEKADYIFGKYSRLLRSSVINSDKIFVPLLQEIEDVENYLILEKFRMDNKFDYEINILKNLNTEVQIPKTLLHAFVENAVKHGLKHLISGTSHNIKSDNNIHRKGKIELNVNKKKNIIILQIKDNGIGREKAKQYSTLSTGKGLQILDNILLLYHQLTKKRIIYKIRDKYDSNGNSDGTEVSVFIAV